MRLRRLAAGAESERADWAALVRRANLHYAASLVRFNLERAGVLDSLPPEQRAILDGASREWAARHLAWVSETERLSAAFYDAGVEAIPLKGAALMAGNYYPRAGLRAASDLDLLVDPASIEKAERVAADCGYEEIPGRRDARPRQRLENERNHIWPRRGPSGLILELHFRAFRFVRGERDLGFHGIRARALQMRTENGTPLILPSPADLALHLVHHTIVDLQTTLGILRTMADLHFIFEREEGAQERMLRLADDFGFGGSANVAIRLLRLLEEGTLEDLDAAGGDEQIELLLDAALREQGGDLADAARLFEYLEFGRHPIRKTVNLLSLLFTPRAHLEQLYGKPARGRGYLNYLRRPLDLLRKFNRRSLSLETLWRVWRLKRLASKHSQGVARDRAE
jgi:hypothetical protein